MTQPATKPDSRQIFGAEIQYFRLDPRYWEPVIQHLKDSGLHCVTTYVQWSTHLVGEPDKKNPAGKLDFAGKTNPRLNLLHFLELVEKHGLQLNFRCGPFCCNEMVHGGYPPWLVFGDPSLMVWDWQNRTTQGYWIGRREGSQPSYLHPEYLAWCDKWLAEVDRIIVPHLHSTGGCITMLNLDNEISYIVKDGMLDSDYNPVNVAPGGFYHQFLTEKYGTAAKLPYGQKYAKIDQVLPPRAVPETVGDDFAWYADWMEFKTWVMGRYIRHLRASHEANGVKGLTFMTNFNPHLPEGIPTRMPAFEQAVGPGGIVGYDFYRGTFMSYSGYHSMARVLKLMNATLKYTWSAEFMAGTWNKVLNGRVSDDHMRFMARCALAQGCKSIAWFMFHDRDCWGDAPVSSHGHARPSLDVLKEIPHLLFDQIKDWDALVPQMDVAVIYDLAQHLHTSIGDPMPCADNDLHVGKPSLDGTAAGKASQEYLGIFRLVEQAGMQAGVVDTSHDFTPLARYPVVFLPGSPVISHATHKGLLAYLKQGGTVILTGPWPTRTEDGQLLKFLNLRSPSGPETVLSLPVNKGTLIWHKAFVAQDKAEEESPEHTALVAQWLAQYASRPHVRLSVAEPVSWVDWAATGGGHKEFQQPRNLGSAILHRGPDERILFVLNHYPEAARFLVEFSREQAKRLVNLATGEVIPLKDSQAVLDIDRKCAELYRVE